MRLVIDIPDEEYERIQAMDWKNGHRWYSYETIAIHNGTPIPKGCGRLIDADALYKEVASWGMNDYEPSDFLDEIDRTPSIIDKEQRNDTQRILRDRSSRCNGTD